MLRGRDCKRTIVRNLPASRHCGLQRAMAGRFRESFWRMWRLYDQPRPIAWWFLRFVSDRYRHAYNNRQLEDWQRIAVRRAHYLPAAGILYVRNEKAACSTLGRVMQNAGCRLEARGETGHLEGMRATEAILPALNDPGVYRFSFVRHPVTRALSAFNNLFAHQQNKARWRHYPYLGRTGLRFGEASEANFDRYIAYVREVMGESAMFCDNHIRTQSINLGVGHISYNRIGKIENYDADLQQILEEGGIADIAGPGKTGKLNRGQSGGFLSPTNAQLREIYAIYEEDYQRFAYPLEMPGDRSAR